MLQRIEHQDNGPGRMSNAKEYVKAHEKQMDFMYGPFIKDLKQLNVTGKCLEVGAGPGLFTTMFARQFPGTHITVTDISPIMISLAKQTIKKYGLEDRIDFCLLDVNDGDVITRLGKFNLIYSIYSMHHWQGIERGVASLLESMNRGGMLYLGDLKRVWWLYCLPTNNNDVRQIRAAYRPSEIKQVFKKLGVVDYRMKTLFPYFMQSIVVRKSGPVATEA